jgi:SPP1 family predicted phage head-tail adaptor
MNERIGRKTLATELRHYITIQFMRKTDDGEGGFIETWHDRETIAAAIYPIRAEQLFEFRSINVEATHIIKIRGKINIVDEVNRFYWDVKDKIFEILTIENIQEQDWVKVITCKEHNSTSGDESQTTTTTDVPTTTTTAAP